MKRILGFSLAVLVIGFGVWLLNQDKPLAEVTPKDDTGLTRESAEDLMRTVDMFSERPEANLSGSECSE